MYEVEASVEISEWLTAEVTIDFSEGWVSLKKLTFHGGIGDAELLVVGVDNRSVVEMQVKEILLDSGRWETLREQSIEEA